MVQDPHLKLRASISTAKAEAQVSNQELQRELKRKTEDGLERD